MHSCSLVPRTTRRFRLHKRMRAGVFHVHDVKGIKMVERSEINVGTLGLVTARRAKVPGNIPHVSS